MLETAVSVGTIVGVGVGSNVAVGSGVGVSGTAVAVGRSVGVGMGVAVPKNNDESDTGRAVRQVNKTYAAASKTNIMPMSRPIPTTFFIFWGLGD